MWSFPPNCCAICPTGYGTATFPGLQSSYDVPQELGRRRCHYLSGMPPKAGSVRAVQLWVVRRMRSVGHRWLILKLAEQYLRL